MKIITIIFQVCIPLHDLKLFPIVFSLLQISTVGMGTSRRQYANNCNYISGMHIFT